MRPTKMNGTLKYVLWQQVEDHVTYYVTQKIVEGVSGILYNDIGNAFVAPVKLAIGKLYGKKGR